MLGRAAADERQASGRRRFLGLLRLGAGAARSSRSGADRSDATGDGLSLAWVTADLALSRAPRGDEWSRVVAAGVRAVAEVRAEATDDVAVLTGLGVAYRRFTVPEGASPSPQELTALTDWVGAWIDEARPVLIHCREGRGRSALAACAVLVRYGHGVAEAYDLVRKARPMIALSEDQVDCLTRFASGSERRLNHGA